ncbi:MAG: hypothetical protein DWQ04_34690 [Chloroflexi bacterium]|nr:MAG: hypothetical protein DWQ04_34690 [Chloroflexota bacterium]
MTTQPDSLEFEALQALESHVLPTPSALIQDCDGSIFGYPAIVIDYVDGESLLSAIQAGAEDAVEHYLDSVCLLQSITSCVNRIVNSICDLPNRTTVFMGGGVPRS